MVRALVGSPGAVADTELYRTVTWNGERRDESPLTGLRITRIESTQRPGRRVVDVVLDAGSSRVPSALTLVLNEYVCPLGDVSVAYTRLPGSPS